MTSPIEYLKGVGPQRGEMLRKELSIFTFKDLLEYYPFRHVDRTRVNLIRDITPNTDYIQVAGRITSVGIIGEKRAKRLVAEIRDQTGTMELIWFQGITWMEKTLTIGSGFRVFGKVSFFQGQPQMTHPEIESLQEVGKETKAYLEPVYPTTEKLKARGLGGRQIGKLTQTLVAQLREQDLPENLPEEILQHTKLVGRFQALQHIHFPPSPEAWQAAMNRLKFEEFFIAQLRMGLIKSQRHRYSRGVVFSQVGELFNDFYENHLPFQLTGAQKRVVKEIRKDTGTGKQMNRLLQGDVGSGKTIVALLVMLLAADNGYQSCLMAPTEILARQHYANIAKLLKDLPVNVKILTGTTKKSERKKILEELASGTLHFIIGTHALVEDPVIFNNLGLAVVDEQHRFGVAQRAKLWAKATIPPHVLVMTATPIPRTLAMTAYGDLDYSVMDELPPNRKPIQTVHRYEQTRSQVMGFIRSEIEKGRQAYIIFPLIEESEKMDYENLMKGYENVKAYFPEPKFWISMVHGRQTNEIRETNMQRFKDHDTQIMVATTVIEVGVDVPNASVMVIESAEKFGLSQLHQLRGRVGRGSEKSFCILLTSNKLNNDALERLKTMVATTDGFKIAEKDLELRGPGDIEGTRQSGMLNFKLANIMQDREWLELAKDMASRIIDTDPDLSSANNLRLKNYLQSLQGKTAWSKIS
ncbi:ATP-dependent DNA helicase RecG [Pseudobacter ginsenosidimutans]|uniref:ATP-dependent DNA helicase RecG n=1 Tax=Pseudobacter ginsenosidimutans TaxID=661488 RepID=A0A4Q7MQJ5_9BACT|nr:ATP-dependent DNA helicase RecG [Pseudobacter ginsenosidimutans]QEC42344.1 ATP-dependent DNA helicase RecG [Pseudobacter ginsenosidimutans]RZS70807.1 ATP-dependent DNA helicase RecG [Pseudobacter ginsenosidimutans]